MCNDWRGVSSNHSCERWPNSVPMRRVSDLRSSHGTTPSTVAVPLVGCKMPVSILIDVDLPAPLGPMKATRSLAATSNVTPRTASTTRRLRARPVAKVFVNPRTSIVTTHLVSAGPS
jgi:hypothetical protein